jgi:hypothetical protein
VVVVGGLESKVKLWLSFSLALAKLNKNYYIDTAMDMQECHLNPITVEGVFMAKMIADAF